MHKEILSQEQLYLVPVLQDFVKNFFLAGGTALALQLGHRQSIDLDLFSAELIDKTVIRNKLLKRNLSIEGVLVDTPREYTIVVHGVKMTFAQYPFTVEYPNVFEGISVPEPVSLAAMKAYALGRRTKWKDYVDIYSLLKKKVTLGDISTRARRIFGGEFNEKLFRVQLAYKEDIDFTEEVIWMPGFEATQEEILRCLEEESVRID